MPKDNLLRRLQHLDESGSAERQAARQKRQEQSCGEILTTFLAYKLDHAAEKMALGLAIGDPSPAERTLSASRISTPNSRNRC